MSGRSVHPHQAGAMRLAVGLLLLCSACSTFPHCVASGVPDAIGRWRYAGRLVDVAGSRPPQAAELGRPDEIELRADGTFRARFEPVASTVSGAPAGPAVPPGERTGRWSGGRFCVEALFAPWAEIGTQPSLPGVASIQLSGGKLIVLGSNTGMDDVVYTLAPPLPQ